MCALRFWVIGCNPMGWATGHIGKLNPGETVSFRPRGHSMKPKVNSGDLVTVEPLSDESDLSVGDIVLCKVSGQQYLHVIKALQGARYQIGNNRRHINGWISRNSIYGKCVSLEW